jgi:endonuclease/exonuclease/phosphatase family metal-dependent hydrolase
MRILVWNMAGGFGYDQPRHDRAWRYVQEQDPDIALLQEAVPPSWASEHWRGVVWTPKYAKRVNSSNVPWGSAIVTRSLALERPAADEGLPWLSELSGSVTVARTVEDNPIWLASIHSNAYPVPADQLRLHDAEAVPRCHPSKIWEIELIAPELERLFAGERFLCGGDINAALLFDTRKKGKVANKLLFENLHKAGLIDLRPRHFAEEQRTYFKKGQWPYQLDHAFADAITEAQVAQWRVDTEPATTVPPLSDHAPIEVVLA